VHSPRLVGLPDIWYWSDFSYPVSAFTGHHPFRQVFVATWDLEDLRFYSEFNN